MAPTPIKYPPEGTKVLHYLIVTIIKEGECSDVWKFVARHFENGSSQIKGIDFDQYYSPVAHANYFIIKISIAYMHIITARMLDVSDSFQNTNVPIHEIVYVITSPYDLDWFDISYPNVTLNRCEGQFCVQCMHVI